MHVWHIITGLGTGGTPVMLYKLLAGQTAGCDVRHSVVGLINDSAVGRKISDLGVPVHTLGMSPRIPSPQAFGKLVKLLRRDRPDVIQTWLYHADLMGGLAAPLVGGPPVVWNIRHATLDPVLDSRSTIWAASACARLSSRLPRLILVNSACGRDVHVDHGYDGSKMRVVPNGFDMDRFAPSVEAHRSVRAELGIAPDTPLIGLIARFSTLKGQRYFVDAMSRLAREHESAHFLMCGTNIDINNPILRGWIDATGCPDRFHCLGERSDIPRLQAALDIMVSSSTSEAFSNSIGEAMACGTPAVVTDVGDSAIIVGDAGIVVPSRDCPDIARACATILSLPPTTRRNLSRRARELMQTRFAIETISETYVNIWQEVCGAAEANPVETAQRKAA